MNPKKTKNRAEALHLKNVDGVHHIVGLGNLRVAIIPDGDFWFAQALEVDYAAQGKSPKDVRKQFTEGLVATIKEHLRVHGNILALLKVAPQKAWNDVMFAPNAIEHNYSTFRMYHVEREAIPREVQQFLPFGAIEYMQSKKVAARAGSLQ